MSLRRLRSLLWLSKKKEKWELEWPNSQKEEKWELEWPEEEKWEKWELEWKKKAKWISARILRALKMATETCNIFLRFFSQFICKGLFRFEALYVSKSFSSGICHQGMWISGATGDFYHHVAYHSWKSIVSWSGLWTHEDLWGNHLAHCLCKSNAILIFGKPSQ